MKKSFVSLAIVFGLQYSLVSADSEYTISICKIQMSIGGTAYIKPCNYWYSKAGNHNGWIVWDATGFGGQQMYETASLAKTLGKSVSVRIDTTDSSWYYDNTKIVRQHE